MATRTVSVEAARRKRAARAVKRFKTMIPALRDYARQETGNKKLQLKAGTSSYTDGKVITLQPPIELGDKHPHTLCDERAFGLSVCPECSSRELLMGVLKHEIGHIIHGSFEKPNYRAARDEAMRLKVDVKYIDRLTHSLATKQDEPMIAHVNEARHPWLSFASLVHEDIRCDEARMRHDPRDLEVFRAMNEEILVNGIDLPDGTVTYYADMEKDQQLCMAYLFHTRDIDTEGYVDDEVYADTMTPEARKIMDRALNAAGVEESFEVTVDFFNHYSDLGYFDLTGKSDQDLEELIELLSEFLKVIVGHGFELQGGGAGGRASQQDEQAVEVAVKSLDVLDTVPINVNPPVVHHGKGVAYNRVYGGDVPTKAEFKSDERHLLPALTAARIAFSVNARAKRERNQTSGRIDGKMLARRVPFQDERMFKNVVRPTKRNYHVVIGMDASGSTTGSTLEQEKLAVLAMADTCDRLGVTFEVWAHTTEFDDAYTDAPSLYKIKDLKEPWADKQRDLLRRLGASGANLDGHTLQFYRKRVEMSKATDKILMYYTDGAMPASNYTEELEVLKSEIELCRKRGITLMAVGMGTDSPKAHGFDTAVINSEKDYRKVVEHLGKRLR